MFAAVIAALKFDVSKLGFDPPLYVQAVCLFKLLRKVWADIEVPFLYVISIDLFALLVNS